MNKLSFLGVAGLAWTVAIPAFAADLPMAVKSPAPFATRFTWTGCYGGGHVGGAFERRDATDPAVLIEEGIAPGSSLGTPATTAKISPTGTVLGGQLGCDYQFSPNWVVGIEGAASAGIIKGHTTVGLPAGNPGDSALVTVSNDLITAITGRLGYAVDHWLLYGKGGVAWTDDKYSITGTFLGTPFDAEGLGGSRIGWTAGAGAEWAFADDWSVRLEYDYYDFGTHTVNMIDTTNFPLGGPVSYRQTTQTVKLGVNFHVWGAQ
jgi:outer membrane immunogenic protein